MNASEFKKLSTKHLTPKLREKGWKGSGFNFYKTNNSNVIQIISIQGSWLGGSVCCETAIHFDFMPDLAGNTDLSKISSASCLIRQRLSPKDEGDYHWTFKKDEEQNIQSLNQIFEALEKFGEKFFKDFENFPHPFDKIKPNDFINNTRILVLDKHFIYNEFNFIWALKEINLKIDNLEKAKEFSKIGIEKATKYFQKIINDTKGKKQKELNNQFLETLIKKLKIE